MGGRALAAAERGMKDASKAFFDTPLPFARTRVVFALTRLAEQPLPARHVPTTQRCSNPAYNRSTYVRSISVTVAPCATTAASRASAL